MREKIKEFLQSKDVSYGQIEESSPESLVFHTTASGYAKAKENQKVWEEELGDGTYVAPSDMFGMYVIIFEKDAS